MEFLNNAATGGGVGALVAFVLLIARDSWKRRSIIEGLRTALAQEIEICRNHAETYLQDPIQAPLYRLPTPFYTVTLPELTVGRKLNSDQVRAVMLFYNQVETLNRGLDQINSWRGIDSNAFTAEHNRNEGKATDLVSKFYPPARDAVAPTRPWCIRAWFQGGP